MRTPRQKRKAVLFKNKNIDGSLNICGGKIAGLRKQSKLSQRAFADKLQLLGLDLNKNAIQKVKSGSRFVTDIELKALAKVFEVSVDELLKWNAHKDNLARVPNDSHCTAGHMYSILTTPPAPYIIKMRVGRKTATPKKIVTK